MNHRRYSLFLFLLSISSISLLAQSVTTARVQRERPDLRRFFSAFNAEGTFVLYAINADSCIRYTPDRAKVRFLPASTYKIFNTMAALDAGSIPDDSTVLKWDRVKRSVSAWNQDQDMRTAFRNSTVWFYQELARRTGEKRLRDMMKREQYGNANDSGGVDMFWLTGGLRISANEQIDCLTKLHHRTLGFSGRAQDIVCSMMLLEKKDHHTLRGKTGWTEQDGNQIGWFVGFVERKDETYVYALNLGSPDPDFPMREARVEILKGVLKELGVAK